MRSRPPDLSQADLDRRLARLRNDLAGVRPARPEAPPAADLTRATWWDEHTRPAPPRAAPSPPARRPLPAPRPALPGRHAHRSRVALGAPQLAVVAVVVALGLAVTAWWLVRGSAHPADDLAAAPAHTLVSLSPAVEPVSATSGGPAAPSSGASAADTAPDTVTVDVAGKVRHPGIAVLDAGARVVDALEAAGGARPGVDLTALNLARVLVDGEQVLVGTTPPTGPAATAATSPAPAGAAPGAPTTLVNLNTATAADLDTLPDVGPVTAQSILTWRDQHGGFSSVDELLEVDGIGDVTLGKLAPYVTV